LLLSEQTSHPDGARRVENDCSRENRSRETDQRLVTPLVAKHSSSSTPADDWFVAEEQS
jgi:hypothetical protein